MTLIPYAHSVPGRPHAEWEPLADHLATVASRAASFAEPFGWAEIARLAGRLHDIGKLSPAFQAYIRGERPSGDDHSAAGARIALDTYDAPLGRLVAAAIAAHHAGLADGIKLDERMAAARNLRALREDIAKHGAPLPWAELKAYRDEGRR
jgi:CRISPR-associated endonuclease/helicase Cas3